MILEVLLVLITVVLVLDYFNKKRRSEIFNQNGITGPRSYPIIGGAHIFARATPVMVFRMLNELMERYGKTWYMWVVKDCALFTTDITLVEGLLTSQSVLTKNAVYGMLESWLGNGLLLSAGKKWFTRRKLITPTFHFTILEQFVEVFDRQSDVLVQQLHDKADGVTVVNMFPIVCLTALDIIAETAMGVSVNAQKSPNLPYVKAVTIATEITAIRIMRPLQRFDFTMRLSAPSDYKKLMNCFDIMHSYTNKVIKERRDALEKSFIDDRCKSSSDDFHELGTKKRSALLDMLLQSSVNGLPLSNKDIREEVDTFMFAGHDTTTSAISFTLYLISRHPDVQQRLFEEIQHVIGEDKRKLIQLRDLQDLKFMECVIKESLRLFPPVPFIGRYTTEDVVLNGTFIPAHINVIVLMYQILRDPTVFPNPDVFRPERFCGNAKNIMNPFSYTPFSAGPRNCIGQKFAMLEMKSIISKVLRFYELLPLGAEVQREMHIVLRSSTGTQLGLKPRL